LDIGELLRLLTLFICLFFSAFFSGSEVALFSLDKKQIRDLKKNHKIVGGYIQVLLDNPRKLLVTILLGNTVVNTAASIIAVLIALDLSSSIGISKEVALFIQIILLTIVILFFGEVTPKLWANKYPAQFSKMVAIPLYWLSVIFTPISKLLTELLKLITANIKSDKAKTALHSTEFSELVDLGAEKGTFEEGEHEIIQSIVDFKHVTAREVMTPRVDIVAVSTSTDYDALMKIITETGHSRIPLYENNLDNILGIVYAKDMLPYLSNPEIRKTMQLRKIARDAIYVPGTKLINDLLREFQEKKMHLGIVVDEYGGTAGLISLEDILEEIVGDIRDEYDKGEKEITKVNDTNFIVLGKTAISELNDLLEQDFSSEKDDYDTVGGFIYNHAGSIPTVGFQFTFNNYKFTVKEVVNKRINKVVVEKLKD